MIQIISPNTYSHSQIHVLRTLAFQEVGFLQRAESKVIKHEIPGKIEHCIERLGMRLDHIPKFRGNVVAQGRVDISDGCMCGFLEITHENTSC